MATSILNNRGFTLIELMVATVITLVGLLGLVQVMNYAAQENVRNMQRDEAVQIGEDWMARMRALPYGTTFSMISTCPPPACSDGKYNYAPVTVASRIRNGKASYTVLRTTTVNGSDPHADIGVQVRWQYKNITTSHEVHSIRYRDDK